MPETPYVFISLLTTGASPEEDRIVEVAGVRPAESGAEEFSALADPGPLNPAVTELTGLRRQDTAGKPAPAQVARDLVAFTAGLPAVAYGAEELARFLEAAGVRPPRMIDARHLARIALPAQSDYSLAGIAQALDLETHGRRALNQAWLLARVWSRLVEAFGSMPLPAQEAICRIAEAATDPLAPVFSAAAPQGMELTSDPEEQLAGLFASHNELLRQAQSAGRPEPTEEALRTDAICRMFHPGGRLGEALPQYEQRGEQVEMVGAVCDALSEGRHLMVEAATGTGKSLAYLVPAIAWTCRSSSSTRICHSCTSCSRNASMRPCSRGGPTTSACDGSFTSRATSSGNSGAPTNT
jgi:ATP-dependent DNA helicase DinG